MSAFLKQLVNIEKKTKYTVYGWVRELEKALKLSNIPDLVTAVCILYLGDNETFEIVSASLKLSDDKKVITKCRDDTMDYCAYGCIKISSTSDVICRWNIKLNHMDRYLRVGVSSQCDILKYKMLMTNLTGYNYFYDNDGSRYNGETWSYGLKRSLPNDVVSVYLDLTKKEVAFYVNDQKQDIICPDIVVAEDIEYRLFVSLVEQGDSVQILDFHKIDPNNN